MTAPLAGLKVLELARVLAGPWAGQLLADLGADVIKVERPETGDDTRAWGPPFLKDSDGRNLGTAYYHSCNRGKRSIALDFEVADDLKKIVALAAEADVLIENFKVGGLRRYGLAYEALRKANPRLIYCSITGFGQSGPYANRAGYDFMIQALGGMMHLTGDPAGEPQKAGIAVADLFTGVYSVVAIQAALLRRTSTNVGAYIDMALLDTQVSVLGNHGIAYLMSGMTPPRQGNAHPSIAPYQVFPASDGHIVIAIGNDTQFVRLCQVLGVPDLGAAPEFATNAARVVNRALMNEKLNQRSKAISRDDLLARLAEANIPSAPINTISDAFAEPQVVHRQLEMKLETGGVPIGGIASPIVIDGVRMAAPNASPILGADPDAKFRG